ncbi:MAG: HutD family protein [Dokdonella sp.]
MSALRLIAGRDCARTRWKNGGGWTTELARDVYTGGDGVSAASAAANGLIGSAFNWRVSIAQIECDGPFSVFPGIERDLLLLEGNGIELDIGDAPPIRLAQRFGQVHFAGEASVQCRLLAGPTRDFNVMTRRDRVCAEVVARPLVGPMVIFPAVGVTWLAHAFSGHADARAGTERVALAAGDTLRIDFNARGAPRVVLDGGGELVLVKLEPTPASSANQGGPQSGSARAKPAA